MKKFSAVFFTLLVFVTGVMLYGCGRPELRFNETQIAMPVGQELELESLVTSSVALDRINFTSTDVDVVFVTPENTLSARGQGEAIVYAQVDGVTAQVSISVGERRYEYNAPLGLRYDTESALIVWERAYAVMENGISYASSYAIELTREGGESTLIEGVTGTSYAVTEAGTYSARVMAESGNQIASGFSSSIEFVVMAKVAGLSFDKAEGVLTWSDSVNSSETVYRINVDGIYLADEIVKRDNTSFSYSLNTSRAKEYDVFVAAFENSSSDFNSKTYLTLTRLASPSLSLSEGKIVWSAVAYADGYEATVIDSNGESSQVSLSTNEFDLEGEEAGEYTVSVKAVSSSNVVLESDYSTSIKVNKLARAEMVFNKSAKTFSLTNLAGNTAVFEVTNDRTGETFTHTGSSYVFDRADSDTYTVRAYFSAGENDIRGSYSREIKVTNLARVSGFAHTSSDGVSYISFSNVGYASRYNLYRAFNSGANTLFSTYTASGTFELGRTDELFGQVGTYTLMLEVLGSDVENEHYYLGNSVTTDVTRLGDVASASYDELSASVSWDSVSGATNYEYEFVKDGVPQGLNETTSNGIQITSSFTYGTYSLRVRAKGNGSSVLSSLNFTSSNEFDIHQTISNPQLLFDRETLIATLIPTDDISNTTYELIFYNAQGERQLTATTLVDGRITLNLGEYISEAGEYRLTAQAKNSHTLVEDSAIVEAKVRKLEMIDTMAYSNGTVSGAGSLLSQDGISAMNPTHILINGQETTTLDSAVEFEIKIRLNSISSRTTDGVVTYFLNSDYQTFRLNRISAPEGLSYNVTTSSLVWTGVANAQTYQVTIDGAIKNPVNTNSYEYITTQAFIASVKALPASFSEIGAFVSGDSSTIGLVESIDSSSLLVLKADEVSSLTLDTSSLMLSWVAPTNVSSAQVYEIYLDSVKLGETTSLSYQLSNITEARSYFVSVRVKGADFIASNGASIEVVKLTAPSALVQDNLNHNLFTVVGADSSSVSEVLIDGQASSSLDLSSLTTEEGRRTVNIKFVANSFVDGKYYLGSETSSFIFSRMATPTGLDYTSGTISWGEVYGASYVIYLTSGNTSIEDTSSVNSYITSLADTFSASVVAVYASAQSPVPNVEFRLDSTPSESLSVTKENAPSALSAEILDSSVTLSWTYSALTSFEPSFEVYIDEALITTTEEMSVLLDYSFDEEKAYSVKVRAVSNKFIASNFAEIIIERIAAPQSALLLDETLSLTSLPEGVSEIEFNATASQSFDASTVTSDSVVTVRLVAKAFETGDDRYYISSRTVSFKLSRLQAPSVTISGGRISWQTSSGATSVTLRIGDYEIANLTGNYLALDDERLIENLTTAGSYNVSIKYNAENSVTLGAYDSVNDTPIGYLTSNYSSSTTLQKLSSPTNVRISADSSPVQTSVTLMWGTVSGASSYNVYLNGEFIENVADTQRVFGEEIVASGEYEFGVVAVSNADRIASTMATLTVTRYSAPSSLSVTAEALASWEERASATYSLTVRSGESEVFSINSLSASSYNLTSSSYFNEFEGGALTISVLVRGDGLATLSSPYLTINATKLYAPTLDVDASSLSILRSALDDDKQDLFNFSLTISMGGEIALDALGNRIENRAMAQSNSFVYPDAWEAGEYTFLAQATALDSASNLINSNTVTVIKTRLGEVSGMRFVRSERDSGLSYTADETGLTYLSDEILFLFDEVTNASSYSLFVNSYTSNNFTSGTSASSGAFAEALSGNFTITMRSLASDDSNFINSKPTTVSGSRLQGVTNFRTQNGIISWAHDDNRAQGYLIRANFEIDDTVYSYWQGTSSARVASLNGLEAGSYASNILALGNVTTAGTSQNVVLDSMYMAEGVTFTKLETPDVTVLYGFLAGLKNDNSFYVTVDGQTFTLLTKLEADTISADRYLLESSSFTSSLDPSLSYTARVQLRNSAQTTIYSDLSASIPIKVLENVNASGDIKLTLSSDNTTTRYLNTYLAYRTSANAYGEIIYSNNSMFINSYSLKQTATTSHSLTADRLEEYGAIGSTIRVASLGSSELDGGYYYLNSSFTTSETINRLEKISSITLSDDTFSWAEIPNATGYYLFINDAQYVTGLTDGIFTGTSFSFPSSFTGGREYTFRVVPIVTTPTHLAGEATYFRETVDEETGETSYGVAYKLPEVELLSIVDGALIWQDGYSGLDTFSLIQAALTGIDRYFAEPFVMFTQNTTLDFTDIVLSFRDVSTGASYNLTIEGFDYYGEIGGLLTDQTLAGSVLEWATQSGLITDITGLTQDIVVEYILQLDDESFGAIAETLDYGTLDFVKATQTQVDNLNSLADAAEQFVSASMGNMLKVMARLIEYKMDKIYGWPHLEYKLFEELAGSGSLPAGSYRLSITQKGNGYWISSNASSEIDVYIPDAPRNVTIEASRQDAQGDRQFIMSWNNVTVPSAYDNTFKYAIIAEDSEGNREKIYEIAQTGGSGDRTSLNLVELVDNDLLLPKHKELYVIVIGDDSSSTIMGKTSNSVFVDVLTQAQLELTNGVLSWSVETGATNLQIIATGTNQFDKVLVEAGADWYGDEMTENLTYSLEARAIGEDYYLNEGGGVIRYIIHGKKTTFDVTKLSSPNASVTLNGIFEWGNVADSSGYVVYVDDANYRVLTTTSFESDVTERVSTQANTVHNYKFRAGGYTGAVTEGETYFFISRANNSGSGLNAILLANITDFGIDAGELEWGVATDHTQNIIKTEGYDDAYDIKYFYIITTQDGSLDETIDESAYSSGGTVKFGGFNDLAEGAHTIIVKKYAYWQNSSNPGEQALALYSSSTEGNDIYILRSRVSQTATEKLPPITNGITIENGYLTWDLVSLTDGTQVKDYRLVFTPASGTSLTSEYTVEGAEANWWDASLEFNENTTYTVQIRANGGDSYLNSSYIYFTSADNTQVLSLNIMRRVAGLTDSYINVTPTNVDGQNSLVVRIYSGADSIDLLSYGFNIRRRELGSQDEWTYSYDLATTNSGVLTEGSGQDARNYVEYTISVPSAWGSFSYELQSFYKVPNAYSNTSHLASMFWVEDNFAVPEALDEILIDEASQQFRFVHEQIEGSSLYYGYNIEDRVVSETGETLYTFDYTIDASTSTAQEYVIYDSASRSYYVWYAPTAVGRHIVAVSRVSDVGGKLVSQPCESQELEFNLFDVSSPTDYASMGTEQNPYLISTAEEFMSIAHRYQTYSYMTGFESGYYFRQTQNLTLTSTTATSFVSSLNATYDGNNNSITYTLTGSNASSSPTYSLFGQVMENGIVQNLTLSATFNTRRGYFGGIAGTNSGTISNINVTALTVSANGSASSGYRQGGGVAYTNQGTIQNCLLSGEFTLTNVSAFGGIAYQNNLDNASITQCGNNATFNITETGINTITAGGIVASNLKGTVSESYNKGQIYLTTTSAVVAGGIVGSNSSSVTYCYNTGLVNGAGASGTKTLGGLIGSNTGALAYSYSVYVSSQTGYGEVAGSSGTGASYTSVYCSGTSALGSGSASGITTSADAQAVTNGLIGTESPFISRGSGEYPVLDWELL